MPKLRTITLAALVAACALVVTSGPTSAQTGDAKPTACGDQLAFKDPAGDRGTTDGNVQGAGLPTTDSSEILRGFLRYDPSKGPDALTFNTVIKDLKLEVPTGATSLAWVSYYRTPDDTLHFVRAILDFTGEVVFEFGNFTPNPAGVVLSGLSLYEGTTNGKMFEGPEGVVQIVIPGAHAPVGTKLTNLYSTTTQGRTLPNAAPPQVSRGLSVIVDTAPDDAPETAPGTYTVGPCTEAPATTTTPTGTAGQPSAGAALPVTLVTKSAKAAKKKSKSKTLSLKLKSSEAVTKIGAQLLKGKKVVGTGKLASLNGTGTLKLKLKSKLKKGSYTLNLVGNRASGERATVAFKLKAK